MRLQEASCEVCGTSEGLREHVVIGAELEVLLRSWSCETHRAQCLRAQRVWSEVVAP